MAGSEMVAVRKDLEAENQKQAWPLKVLNSFVVGKDKIFILVRD